MVTANSNKKGKAKGIAAKKGIEKWDAPAPARKRNGDFAVRGRDTSADAFTPDKLRDDLALGLGTFARILAVQSVTGETEAMRREIISILNGFGGVEVRVDDIGNIYATKGKADSYPTFAAHIDTVHDIIDGYSFGYRVTPSDTIISAWDTINNCATGVGGDDKVGIYIALKMVALLDDVKAAFFVDEEWGCIGSERADMSFFDDSRFVLEADRKGNGDFIDYIGTTELLSDDFGVYIDPIIRKYGRRFQNGGMTDVMTLKEKGLAVSCANMSCGYYLPHTPEEYISWVDVVATLSMVYEMAVKSDAVFPHLLRSKRSAFEYAGMKVTTAGGAKKSVAGRFLFDYDYCETCFDEFVLEDLIEITADTFLCPECFESLMDGADESRPAYEEVEDRVRKLSA